VLAKYLLSHVKTDKAESHRLDYECPLELSAVNSKSSSLKGSRLQYLHALQAKLKAQARHRELQQTLESLRSQDLLETPIQTEIPCDQEATRGYMFLLRQRRRIAELEIIQNSLEKLLATSPLDNRKDPKAIVQDALGEQPGLPVERLENISGNQDNDSSMFKLKKEVLEAKASMDRAKAARAEAQSAAPSKPTLEQQVYALGCARDELVAWIEGELGKMNEESALLEDASPVKQWPKVPTDFDADASRESIQKSYNQYTTSRSDIIDAHASITSPSVDEPAAYSREEPQSTSKEQNTPREKRPITQVAPLIPSVAQTAQNERTLLQQTVYLQAKLSSAEEELKESLARLSDESHLLPSGPAEPRAWAAAAREAGATTRAFVEEQLQDSQQDIHKIAAIAELFSLQSKVLASS
jgi:hypothetical protein